MDTSFQSHADLSLGSLASGYITPARNIRKPSSSTIASSALVPTPSPPNAAQFARRRFEEQTPKRRAAFEDLDDVDDDVIDTPGKEKIWSDGYESNASRSKQPKGAAGKGGLNLTLRDQEKASNTLLLLHSTYNVLSIYSI
jgi:hypothetical protein